MTARRTALRAFIVGLTGFSVWYGYRLVPSRNHTGTAARVQPNVRVAAIATPAAKAEAEIAVSNTVTHLVPPSAIDYSKAFREATDYKQFILGIIPAARSGDRDAQYYVHAALAYCDDEYRFYFRPGGKTLNLEEAIEMRNALPGPSATEAIKRAYNRCHEVNDTRDPAWGTADEWLYEATEGGQPLAQMETAEKIFLKPSIRAPQSADPTIARGSYGDARALVRDALETKDPGAIFDMSEVVGFLKKEESNAQLAKEAVTWQYVACLRGLDCGVDAEWYRQFCLSDPNCLKRESGVDYLRRTAPLLGVLDLDESARELNAKIDAGAWAELGLGN